MRKILIMPIIIYQKIISPFLPRSCRFNPTCSEYTKPGMPEGGYEKEGLFKGVKLGLKRLSKCHPWSGSSGYDPLK